MCDFKIVMENVSNEQEFKFVILPIENLQINTGVGITH